MSRELKQLINDMMVIANPVMHDHAGDTRLAQFHAAIKAVEAELAKPAESSTPSSKWKKNGEADPHGNAYDCERAALTLGYLTDDELANAVFLHYDIWPNLQDIIDGKAHSPIVYVTAAKERIRWLSRKLEEASADLSKLEQYQTPYKYLPDHPMFNAFIRAFWRRINAYKNEYGKELPEEMPVQFKASMETALLVFDK
jgi:hypothetical protein